MNKFGLGFGPQAGMIVGCTGANDSLSVETKG
jgi:hypothetical protein